MVRSVDTRPLTPLRPSEEEAHVLWSNIRCPVLHIRGTESWASDPAADGLLDIFQNARATNVEGAGHWVHHDRLDEFLSLTREFLTG